MRGDMRIFIYCQNCKNEELYQIEHVEVHNGKMDVWYDDKTHHDINSVLCPYCNATKNSASIVIKPTNK